jgi:hypothetical protein
MLACDGGRQEALEGCLKVKAWQIGGAAAGKVGAGTLESGGGPVEGDKGEHRK